MSGNLFSVFLAVFFFGALLFLNSFLKKGQKPGGIQLAALPKEGRKKSLKLLLSSCEMPLRWGALFFLLLALFCPEWTRHAAVKKQVVPKKGIAIFLLLDRSGSMGDPLNGNGAKMDWVKQASREFIQKRNSDLVGLVAFARKPDLLVPLTLDHEPVIQKLNEIQVAKSIEEDGTGIGYAIFKTANRIVGTRYYAEKEEGRKSQAYTIKNQVMVVLSDGLQGPNPLDVNDRFRFMNVENAARFAKENGIKIYFIGVVPEQDAATYSFLMQSFKASVEATGGQFFTTSDQQALQKIYDSIDRLEKSTVTPEFTTVAKEAVDLRPLFVLFSLFLLLISILIETLFCRVVP